VTAFRFIAAVLMLALASACAAGDRARAQVRIGIVGWPLDPADALQALAGEFEACLIKHIRAAAPEISVVPQREIRDALFPLLEAATQPKSEDEFARMLARDDVRARLRTRGLRYLVAFAGGTRNEDWRGGILCGAGYGGGGCLGFAWRGERTVLDAALWSLDGVPVVHHEGTTSEANSLMPAFGLPIPIMAQTGTAACKDLGTRIATSIREAADQAPEAPKRPQ